MVLCFTHCISFTHPKLNLPGCPSDMLRQHFYDAAHLYFLAVFGNKVGSEIANFRENHKKLQQGIFESTPALAMLVTEGRAL